MRRVLRAIIGASIVLILGYFAGAFIQVDLWWLYDVMSWTRDSRVVFLFVVVSLTSIGTVLSA